MRRWVFLFDSWRIFSLLLRPYNVFKIIFNEFLSFRHIFFSFSIIHLQFLTFNRTIINQSASERGKKPSVNWSLCFEVCFCYETDSKNWMKLNRGIYYCDVTWRDVTLCEMIWCVVTCWQMWKMIFAWYEAFWSIDYTFEIRTIHFLSRKFSKHLIKNAKYTCTMHTKTI